MRLYFLVIGSLAGIAGLKFYDSEPIFGLLLILIGLIGITVTIMEGLGNDF